MTTHKQKLPLLGTCLAFAHLALLFTTTSYVFGQGQPPVGEKNDSDFAKPAPHDYRFEVASIRPVVPPIVFNSGDPRMGPQYSPGRYLEEFPSVRHLAAEAFGVTHAYQMEQPPWMNTAFFTLNATLPEGATKADIPIMLQHLLEDRFGLKYHRETRDMAGYKLLFTKSGPSLLKSMAPTADESNFEGPQNLHTKDGVPQFSKNMRSLNGCSAAGCWFHGHNRTMGALASDLATHLGVPVIDSTGLEGEYDFTLLYTPEQTSIQGGGIMSPSGSVAPVPSAGGDGGAFLPQFPLLPEALKEQLGLTLEPVRRIPIDVVVIDNSQRNPTAN